MEPVKSVKYFKVDVFSKGEVITGYSATPRIYQKGEPFIELYESPNSQSTLNIKVDVIDSFKVEPVFGEVESPLIEMKVGGFIVGQMPSI